jgi:hypothetical protein
MLPKRKMGPKAKYKEREVSGKNVIGLKHIPTN